MILNDADDIVKKTAQYTVQIDRLLITTANTCVVDVSKSDRIFGA